MSDFADKLIILLLIGLMPVSVIVAARLKSNYDYEAESLAANESIAKINQALAEIESQKADQNINKANPIEIEAVDYVDNGNEIVIEGKAPTPDMNVMVASVLTGKADEKEATTSGEVNENILGEKVELVAVRTDINGRFKFVKKFDSKKINLIEMKFEQGESKVTVIYDLEKGKRVY